MSLPSVLSLSVTSIFGFPPESDLSLSLSVEPDLEVEGARMSFWSEFGGILLIFLDFCSGFRIADISQESLD